MALWSKETGGEKPNWLSEDEKARCYCDDRGWVLVHLDGREEVLVAGSSLNELTDSAGDDVAEKAIAVSKLAIPAPPDGSFSDNDGDGIPQYQDPDDDA